MLIDDSRLELALKRLAKTDALAAELHMKAERAEFKAKATKEAVFLRVEGSSVAERQARAACHPDYEAAMEMYFEALQAHDTMKNERSREVIVIECWRSLNSARSKGLVT
jgi:hypothetical protein